jgi:DNA-binding MarR family transcriptional regulator
MVSMETTVSDPESLQGTATPKLQAHLGYWLRRVSNQVSGAFARALQTRNTSVAEWVVMCQLQECPGMTPAELAARLDLTRGAVSKVIDKLDAKRWVAHATKPEDGRVQLLSLTRQGSRVLPELAKLADKNDREFFEGLNSNEKATLRRLLVKLVELHHIRNVPIK